MKTLLSSQASCLALLIYDGQVVASAIILATIVVVLVLFKALEEPKEESEVEYSLSNLNGLDAFKIVIGFCEEMPKYLQKIGRNS